MIEANNGLPIPQERITNPHPFRMITVPIFQFIAVRFAMLTQGSSPQVRVCGEAFHPYFLSGKSYAYALDWLGQLYQAYFFELQKYQKRFNRMDTAVPSDQAWLTPFTERFLRTYGLEPDQRIIYIQPGEAYPPLLGLSTRQLSAKALQLLYELAEFVQTMPQRTLGENQVKIEQAKLHALALIRPSEIFLTGTAMVALEQALKQGRIPSRELHHISHTAMYLSDTYMDVYPRFDLSEPAPRLYSKDRILTRRLWQSAQRY